MKAWQPAMAEPLVSIASGRSGGATWGRILGVSKDWIYFRMIQNTGELGPLILVRPTDIQDIALDWQAKSAVLKLMDEIEDSPANPDTVFKSLIRSRGIVSIGLSWESGETLARLEGVDNDWLEWTEFTSQGLERGRKMVPLDRVRSIEADGEIERNLASRLSL